MIHRKHHRVQHPYTLTFAGPLYKDWAHQLAYAICIDLLMWHWLDHPTEATMVKLAVIGAGPVGCVLALTLRKQGYSVDLYESRRDMRRECEATLQTVDIHVCIHSIWMFYSNCSLPNYDCMANVWLQCTFLQSDSVQVSNASHTTSCVWDLLANSMLEWELSQGLCGTRPIYLSM